MPHTTENTWALVPDASRGGLWPSLQPASLHWSPSKTLFGKKIGFHLNFRLEEGSKASSREVLEEHLPSSSQEGGLNPHPMDSSETFSISWSVPITDWKLWYCQCVFLGPGKQVRRLLPMLRLRIMTQSPNIEKFVSLDSLIFLPFLIKLQLKDLLLFPSNRFHDDVSWHREKMRMRMMMKRSILNAPFPILNVRDYFANRYLPFLFAISIVCSPLHDVSDCFVFPLEHNCWARSTDFPLILKNLAFSLSPVHHVSPCIGPVHVHRRWFAVSRISFTNWRFTVHCSRPIERND